MDTAHMVAVATGQSGTTEATADTTEATVVGAMHLKLVILGHPKNTTSVSPWLAMVQSAMVQSTMVQFQMRLLLLFCCHTSLATRFLIDLALADGILGTFGVFTTTAVTKA